MIPINIIAMTSLLFFCFSSLPSSAFSFWNIFNSKSKPSSESKLEPSRKPSEVLRIIVISDVGLYPAPLHSSASHNGNLIHDFQLGFEEFSKTLLGKKDEPSLYVKPIETGIMFEQSQVLLQETIREIIASLKTKNVDLVIFGGNQVYSTEHFDLFEDIVYDLQKYSIPYYSLIGAGELRGRVSVDKFISNRFYLLKTKNTNIVVLDNVLNDVVPKFLPEEATEQYVWLKKILTQLSTESEADEWNVVDERLLLIYY